MPGASPILTTAWSRHLTWCLPLLPVVVVLATVTVVLAVLEPPLPVQVIE